MRDKFFFLKKRKKPEGAAQPQTISQIPEKGKCWVVFCFLVFSFFFCQDTEKINKALLQSISSSPHFTPPAQLFLFLRGEACIVTVVGDLFLLFVVCLLFFFLLLLNIIFPRSSAPSPSRSRTPLPPPCPIPLPCSAVPRGMQLSSLPLRGGRSLPPCQAVAIPGVKSRGCCS